MEQSTDRDILQGHYTDIQQELQVKTDTLKIQRQKVRALEREVSDLQAEFQLDRADYLETIRRLEKNVKFWQQLMDKALPLLRRDGRFWDPDAIRSDSEYNDDLGRWKLPDNALARVKLPPAGKKLNHFSSISSSIIITITLQLSSRKMVLLSSHTFGVQSLQVDASNPPNSRPKQNFRGGYDHDKGSSASLTAPGRLERDLSLPPFPVQPSDLLKPLVFCTNSDDNQEDESQTDEPNMNLIKVQP